MNRPIIALDFANQQEIATFLSHFPKEEALYVKVGMEIFYAEGPRIVTWLRDLGHDVFLDLKLHDIPNTVKSAMARIASLDVAMTNVHAAGGKEMMTAAYEGLKEGSLHQGALPKLIAVTQLTSTSEAQMKQDQGMRMSLMESVVHYAKMTEEAGLDGVVCSALEVQHIRQQVAEDFICLTPGIRPSQTDNSDQKRVVTPREAKEIGSSFIVVGRPITQATNPYKAYQDIKADWNGER